MLLMLLELGTISGHLFQRSTFKGPLKTNFDHLIMFLLNARVALGLEENKEMIKRHKD